METQVKHRAPRGTVGVEEKQGKWRIRLPRAVAKDGHRYIATGLDATLENYKKAQTRAREIEEDIKTGKFDSTVEKYKPKPLLTLVKPLEEPTKALELQALWERYCEYREPQVAVTTFRKDYLTRYANCIKSLPSKNLDDAIAIRDYLVETLSPHASKRMITQLSACCKWAVKSGLAKENPFGGMAEEIKVAKRSADDIDPFSAEEREAIVQAFSEHHIYCHYTNFVRFLFLTGCRTGEAIGLQWKHIKQDCSQIHFCESYSSKYKLRKDTKTYKGRKFPCNAVLRELLLSIQPQGYQPDDLVFTSLTGKPINNEGFLSDVWRGCKRHGKQHDGIVTQLVKEGKVERYRPQYNTRHTFITMALEAGVTVPQVAKLVGNSPEIILQHYAGRTLKFEVPVF